MSSEHGARPGLGDGSYDVVVIDADHALSDSDHDRCRLELVVTAGANKGDLIELTLHSIDLDPIDLLGLPGVVEVTAGEPRFLLS